MSPATALSSASVPASQAAASLSVVPVRAGLPVEHVLEVPTHVFNRVAEGALSACVVPALKFMAEGSGISIVDAQNRENGITLQVGRQLNDFNSLGLEKGYKVVELMRSADAEIPVMPATRSPSFALRAADLEKRNFVVMPAHGNIYAPALLDGGTVLLRDDKGNDTPTQMAVVMKGDMPGIAAGYMLATPPQRRMVRPEKIFSQS